MKTLDRYIVRQFLTNFAILFVVLMSLFVVVDLIVDLDEFIQAGAAHADAWIGGRWMATLGITVGYYGPTVLLVYVFFNGLIVVGAMGFTLTPDVAGARVRAPAAGPKAGAQKVRTETPARPA